MRRAPMSKRADVVIRLARPGEGDLLEGLMRRASLALGDYNEQLEAHPEAIEVPAGQIERGQVIVAEVGDAVAGFAAVVEGELDGLFVEPALGALAGAKFAAPTTKRASLAKSFKHRGQRPTYQPCRRVDNDSTRLVVEPLDWKGSADVATLTRADCLAAMPEGDYELAVGDSVEVLLL